MRGTEGGNEGCSWSDGVRKKSPTQILTFQQTQILTFQQTQILTFQQTQILTFWPFTTSVGSTESSLCIFISRDSSFQE
ncbi:hypothetical protein E2320_007302 [Naja naja]|nr:hypothetical protein E2320_007302 [Naja naja]